MAVGHVPCGIAIPQSFANAPVDVTLIKGFVSKAETLGYDSLWVQEQILSDIAILEPVTLLTYAAAVTAKLRLGTSVLLPVIRNPVQLAKSLATLDQLSQGRLIVGVGIGGSADYALYLAKEAIARPVGTKNPDPIVAELEAELYELVNQTGIGPMGLGGDVTALAVHVEHADTHMTLNPVAVNYQCWAARRASAHVSADGSVDFDREF